MNLIVRLFTVSLFVGLAMSAGSTVTFTTGTTVGTANTPAPTASVDPNGYTVTFAAIGWWISDALTLPASTSSLTVWSTVVSAQANLGVGVAQKTNTGGSTCTAIPGATTTLVNWAGGASGATGGACGADLATAYISSPGTSTSALGTNYVTATTPVKWVFVNAGTPSATASIGLTVTYNTATATTPLTQASVTIAAGGANSIIKYGKSDFFYAMYVENFGSAGVVCFQTDNQKTISGLCTYAGALARAITFGSPVVKGNAGATASTDPNGVTVTFTAAGFAIGDSLSLTSSALTIWSTVISAQTNVGVGLVAVGYCAQPNVATTTTLLNGATNVCPSDFATYYVTNTATTSSSAIAPGTPANLVTAGTGVKWVLTGETRSATSTNSIGVSYTVGSGNANALSTVATGTSNVVQSNAKANLNYAFYVENFGTAAVVCFQTDAQRTINPSCTYVAPSSAQSLSAAITGFVAVIILIFFN